MGQISTITVADATPTNRDFQPVSIDSNAVARWSERSAAVAAGFYPLSLSLRQPVPGATSQMYKAVLNLAIPYLVTETINGVSRSVVDRTDRVEVTFLTSAYSSSTNVSHLNAMLRNLLAHASVKDVIENRNNTW